MTTALVTGANRGIGLALCRALRERGDDVIAVCRHSSNELDALDLRVETGIDVSDQRSIGELVGRLGDVTIDVVINNAGVLARQELGEIDAAAIAAMRRQYDVNALGPLLVTQALLPRLAGDARVAIVTSRMGSIQDNTSGGSYGYRMSKAAVNIAGASLAHDLAPQGIAVILLHPGYVATGMTDNAGPVRPEDAACGLLARIDELTLETTGSFRHANGERLPW